MIIYQSRFLTRGEVWFDNQPSADRVDWILYHQRSEPIAGGHWRRFYTQVIDLKQASEALMAAMDGFTAADIKKAEKKDQTTCHRLNAAEQDVVAEFADFYDDFAARKSLEPADRHWLERTAAAGHLELWTAQTPERQCQIYHALYRDRKRVRSVHMASVNSEGLQKEAQRKVGRANRLLIWHCMLHYRNEGIEIFDLGGWYNGSSDRALLGINKFKECFGGKTVCEYEGERLLTLKGWSAVTAARWLTKLKERRESGPTRPTGECTAVVEQSAKAN
ncbi:MAG TPA: hypothetical protein VL361_23225 [Candidatus Limnocylindrales bacterium]|jgi:hypothetical protein|nr:hypothetical protein [Candidatus Limnocylindrales bacterium]